MNKSMETIPDEETETDNKNSVTEKDNTTD